MKTIETILRQKPPYTLEEKKEMLKKVFPGKEFVLLFDGVSESYNKYGVLVENSHKFAIKNTDYYVEFNGNGHCEVFEEDPFKTRVRDFYIQNVI